MKRSLLVLLAGVALVASACGGTQKRAQAPRTPTTVETMTLRAYFLLNGQVRPVGREVPKTDAVAAAALHLLAGLTSQERDLGLESAIPAGTTFTRLDVKDGVASLSVAPALPKPALAQVVYTLTQFPTVRAVELGGKRLTRADFEEETPPILVESPLPYDSVTSPLRAQGTANTFEATFEYDLKDPDGKLVSHHFETATSGSGTRGTFDFAVPFTVARKGLGHLIVYEISAADGSRIHEVEIPIQLGS
ncbi:MAG: Gmad2 immunoglobulin-like domain-containing protein [Gaiellaceae bacterium]